MQFKVLPGPKGSKGNALLLLQRQLADTMAWLRQQLALTAIEFWAGCKDRLSAAAVMSKACPCTGASHNSLLLPKDAKRLLKHTALSKIGPLRGCPHPVMSRQLTTIRKLSNSREGHPTTLSLSPNWRAHSLCR